MRARDRSAASRPDDPRSRTRLVLRGVSVRAGAHELLRGVDFDLAAGELHVLVGPNGAGKSTLVRALAGRVRPSAGRAELDGRALERWSGRDRAARVAWLPQQPEVREPARVLDLVVAARFRFHESRPAAERAAREALSRLGCEAFVERAWPGLSGGERQRVALAALLAQDAPILLLDEPANHLDPAVQIDVYRRIGDLGREGRGILCVTHDVDLVGWLAHDVDVQVWGLSEGAVRFRCAWRDPELPERLGGLFGVGFRSFDDRGRRRLLVTERTR